MEKVIVGVDLKFECPACFVLLTYEKQPHDCPDRGEDEGYVCVIWSCIARTCAIGQRQKLTMDFFDCVYTDDLPN